MDNNSLKHYGVLGMKWGVRRFQNKNGTRTPAGKKRYGDDPVTKEKSEKVKTTKPKKRTVKDLSDAELQAKIKRLEMEKRYKDLSKETATVNKGREFVKKYALDAGKKIILDNATDIVSQAVKHFMAKGANNWIDDRNDKGEIVERVFANNKKKS